MGGTPPEKQPEPPERQPEVVTLKPGLWGVSVDIKELWRRLRRRINKQ